MTSSRKRITERSKEIARKYVENVPNLTLEDVGKLYGITRERVRQIVEKVFPEFEKPKKYYPSLQEKLLSRHQKRENDFWASVDIGNRDECWEWSGYKWPNGYGRCSLRHTGEEYVHRISWTLTYGTIPEELQVLHNCDNPSCVNPNHLYLGTPAENMQDREERYKGIAPQDREVNVPPRRTPVSNTT